MGRRHEQTLLQGRHTSGSQTHEKMFIIIISHQGDSNQKHIEIPSNTSQNGQNQQDGKQYMLWWMWKKKNPLTLLVGMPAGAATLENSVEIP